MRKILYTIILGFFALNLFAQKMVIQECLISSLSVVGSPNLACSSGSVSIDVTPVNSLCTWNAFGSNGASVSPSGSSGSKRITVSYPANTSTTSTKSYTITGVNKSVTIMQAAAPAPPPPPECGDQEPQRSITISEMIDDQACEIVDGVIQARDIVKLDGSFSYTSNGNAPLTIKTNKDLLCDADYIPNPTAGLDRQLETSNYVGSIPGSYSVGANGSANYSIPINLPAGVNGVSPSLGVSYDSGSGNGILGWGWNLGGLSMITRGTKTLFQDGTISSVGFNSLDRFYLDGQRLILVSGTYGETNSVYKTEIDGLVKVVKLSSGFKVMTAAGNTFYGTDSNSRKETDSNTPIYWCVSSQEDLNGNQILYNYITSKEELVIDEISYSGNSVNFYYEDRSDYDKNTTYVNGESFISTNLLKKIEVSINGTKLQEYGFNYTYDLYSMLTEITLSAGNGTKVNSTIIDWNSTDFNPVVEDNDIFNCDPLEYRYFGDFNGDGLTDIVSNAGGSASCKIQLSNSSSPVTVYPGTDFREIRIFDVDNDGLDELLIGCFEYAVGSSYDNMIYYCYEYDNGEIIYNQSKNIQRQFDNGLRGGGMNLLTSDFNGDGDIDYILCHNSYELIDDEDYFLKSYKIGFSADGGDLNDFFINDLIFHTTVNFNGNAKQDLLVRTIDGYIKVYEYNGETHLMEEIYSSFIFPIITSKYQVGDFNGDGLTDFIESTVSQDNTNPLIYYSTGTSYVAKAGPFNFKESTFNTDAFELVHPVDLNNDGKTDILRFYFDFTREIIQPGEYIYSQFTPTLNAKVYVSNGNTFQEIDVSDKFSSVEFGTFAKMGIVSVSKEQVEDLFKFVSTNGYLETNRSPGMNYADFNGDGYNDIMVTNEEETLPIPKIFSMVKGEKQRLVKTITNGLNQNVEFEYSTLLDGEVYSRTDLGTYPLMNLRAPIYVVKKVKLLDNGSEYNYLSYKYKNAKIHKQFGFLGYEEVEIENSKLNTYAKSTFEFIGDQKIRQAKTNVAGIIDGNVVSETTFTNDIVPTTTSSGTKYFQLRTTKKVSENYLNSTMVTTTMPDYNQYNQPRTIEEAYGRDMTITKNITYTPLVNSSYNLPTRVDEITTISSHKNKTGDFSETTDLVYGNASKPFQLTSKISRKGTDKQLTETYTYETFGGLKTASVTAVDETNPRSKEYVYTTNKLHIKEQTTNGQFKTEFVYNSLGQLITQKDHLGNSTSYEYNAFGENTKVTGPTGLSVNTNKYFSNSGPAGTKFVSEAYSEGKGTVYEYYNAKGQLLRKKLPGALNQYYLVDYEYYDNGKLKREYHPYKEGGTKADNNYYEYDEFGRNTNVVTPKGDVTNNYQSFGSKTVRTESPEGWSEKTIDNAGLVVNVKDEGGTINYNYNNRAKVDLINYTGYSIDYEYDKAGNVKSIDEPNLGLTESTYNAFGELKTHTDAKSNLYTMLYDNFGRPLTKTCGTEITSWSYDNTSGKLKSVSNGISTTAYDYDANWLFLESQTETIDGQNFITGFTYNNLGDVKTVTYPSGFVIENVYDNHGNRVQIKKAGTSESIWTLDATDAKGMITNYSYGNNISTTLGFDDKNRPNLISAINTSTQTNVNHWTYGFTAENNLQFRKNENRVVQESFTYDEHNRLKTYWGGTINYADNGNISTKPDVGTYNYNATQPQAVKSITEPSSAYVPEEINNISYNYFNKVSQINDANYKQELLYGPDMQRRIMKTYENNTLKKTKYYVGSYEKIVNEQNQTTKELTYISASTGLVAVNVKDFDNTEKLYYIHSDYLGSIMALTNESGQKVEEYFYDAWGQRKNPANWSQNDTRTDLIIDRGYTGHEHWEHFNLINMNGRVYDPALGRFLSPDPTYQSLSNSQALNKYSYVLNNPFKYTDPSGYNYAMRLFGKTSSGGWVSSGYSSFVNGVMGSHYNAGFGNHGGNQMFAGASQRSNMYFAWQFLYSNNITKTNFGSYLLTGGKYKTNGDDILKGEDAVRWIVNKFTPKVQVPDVDLSTAIASTEGDVVAQSNGGLTASLNYVGMPEQSTGEQYLVYFGNSPEGSLKTIGKLMLFDSRGVIINSWSANSGSTTLKPINSGAWSLTNARSRTNIRMVRDGVGFSVDIGPDPFLGRSLLRIHPDGNRNGNWWLNDGTAGCIGLTGNAAELNEFYNMMSNYLETHGGMELYVPF